MCTNLGLYCRLKWYTFYLYYSSINSIWLADSIQPKNARIIRLYVGMCCVASMLSLLSRFNSSLIFNHLIAFIASNFHIHVNMNIVACKHEYNCGRETSYGFRRNVFVDM